MIWTPGTLLNVSGIYAIINIKTGSWYVGSSKTVGRRLRRHFTQLKNNNHYNLRLQRSYNKWKSNNFMAVLLEETKCVLIREQYYLTVFAPDYNLSKCCRAPMAGRVHKPETILKFKNRKPPSGENHYLYGKKMPNKTIERIRLAHLGSTRSEKTKQKMRETAIKTNTISRIDRNKSMRPVICSNGFKYVSLIEAANKNNVSVATVCDILKGRHKKTRTGVSFEYL